MVSVLIGSGMAKARQNAAREVKASLRKVAERMIAGWVGCGPVVVLCWCFGRCVTSELV
jgi:hypothetical protein